MSGLSGLPYDDVAIASFLVAELYDQIAVDPDQPTAARDAMSHVHSAIARCTADLRAQQELWIYLSIRALSMRGAENVGSPTLAEEGLKRPGNLDHVDLVFGESK